MLALELVHDAAISGQPPEGVRAFTELQRMTMLQLDASIVFVRNPSIRFMGLGGIGSRFDQAANLGFLLGLALDANVKEVAFSVKLEGRKQAGGFRQGMFGPTYELGRFAGLGLSGVGIAQEVLPDTFSLYGEARAKVADVVTVDAMVEHFTFGRTDIDSTVNVTVLKRWLITNARFTVVGLGQQPRYAFTLGARLRFFNSFYVLGSAGTLFFPQADGTLNRGATVSVGAGIDFER